MDEDERLRQVQIKLSIQRLRTLQEKKLALAKKARRDIADLVLKSRIETAKLRVEGLIQDDIYVELIELLEVSRAAAAWVACHCCVGREHRWHLIGHANPSSTLRRCKPASASWTRTRTYTSGPPRPWVC